VEIGMWQLPDRVMFAVYDGGEAAKDTVVNVDLDALNLTPRLPWQELVGVRDLYTEEKAPTSKLDYYGATLSLKAIPPKTGCLVAIRRY